MANIQEDINQIATARYGREVRGSIVNALTLMNKESSEAIDKAVTAQDSATASAVEAKGYADRLVDFGGGTTGQVLTKKSNADFDYSWKESQGGTSDAYETTYGESNVGDTLDIMPRLAGAVQGASPTPKDADTLGGKYRAEDIDLIKENLEGKINKATIKTLSVNATSDATGRVSVGSIDTRSNLVLGFVPSSIGASIRGWSFASYSNSLYINWSTPNEPVIGTLYYITISDLN